MLENLLLRHQLAVLTRPTGTPTTCSAAYSCVRGSTSPGYGGWLLADGRTYLAG